MTRLVRRLSAAVLATALAALGLTVSTTAASADQAPCTISAKLVNSCRPWLGAEAGGYAVSSGFKGRISAHEGRIGRQVDVVHDYLNGAASLSADEMTMARRGKTTLLLNWKPATIWSQAAGGTASVDATIDSMAASIKSLGSTKIMLAIHHEPEDDIVSGGDPNCPALSTNGTAGTTADYVAMWHNVRQRFDAAGVTNVVWVMNYMGWKDYNCAVKDLWPGNDYVDWVTYDPYVKTQTWSATIGTFYNFLTTTSDAAHDYVSKPWGLSEFGYAGTSQTAAYQMYDDAAAGLTSGLFPRLKLYAVWDNKTATSKDDRVGYTGSGVLDPVEQEHYNAFANHARLQGDAVPEVVDGAPPSVSVDPVSPEAVTGVLSLTGTATDDIGVTGVTLLVDDTATTTVPVSSDGRWTVPWDSTTVANGPHQLRVRVSDTARNSTRSDPVDVDVENPVQPPDTTPPAAPVVTALGSAGRVDVSWAAADADDGVTTYEILRDGEPVGTADGTATGFADTGLAEATAFVYTIHALDQAGNRSAASNAVSATTSDVTAPSAPSGLTGSSTGLLVQLTWLPATDNVGVTGYQVYRNGLLVGRSATPSFTDLAPLASATYSVRAEDAAENVGAASGAVTVAAPDTTAPGAATGLTGSFVGSTVQLTWQPASDDVGVTSYQVYRGSTLIGSSTVPSFSDVAPLASATYTVRALDAARNLGPASNTATVSRLDKTPPSAPTALKAAPGVRSAKLTWTPSKDNVGVTRYYLYRNNVKYRLLGVTPTFTDTGLTTGKTYTYKVYAIDAAGNWSPPSTKVTAKAR